MTSEKTRLNKYLALQLGISRREADVLIDTGMVEVNGEVAILGSQILESDIIHVAGKPIKPQKVPYVYLALHKPVGYVCSRRAQGEHPTIYSLLPAKYHNLKPVGRLDRDSSGIILLTNDGDFAYRMTHPKFAKTKVYHVQLDHRLEPLHQQMISDFGVQLEDGGSQFTVSRLDDDTYEVILKEGRNRQIRRTFAALGYTVTKLHRTNFGPYALDDIKSGEHKLTDIR